MHAVPAELCFDIKQSMTFWQNPYYAIICIAENRAQELIVSSKKKCEKLILVSSKKCTN